MEPMTDETEYIVFRPNTFYEMMGYFALPPWRNQETGELLGSDMDSAPLASEIFEHVDKIKVTNVVVREVEA